MVLQATACMHGSLNDSRLQLREETSGMRREVEMTVGRLNINGWTANREAVQKEIQKNVKETNGYLMQSQRSNYCR